MNRFMMIIVICIAVLMTGATSKKMADDNETGEYIFSRNIGPNVIQVVFDTITVSKEKAIKMGWSEEYVESQQGDMITVDYPKIIEEQVDTTNYHDVRMFKLYDYEGNILMEKEYDESEERYALSNNKQYVIFSERPDEYDMDLHTELYDAKGQMLWEQNSDLYFTHIMNNGISIGGWGKFYNKKGVKIGEVENASKDYGDALYIDIFITIAVLDNNTVYRIKRWHGNKSEVQVTDSIGNVKWEKELPYKFARPDEYDLDPEIGIVGIYEKYLGKKDVYNEALNKIINIEDWEYGICYIDMEGNIVFDKKLDLKGDKHIKLSEDKKSFYVYSTNNRLMKLDISNGKELWNWNDKIEYAWDKYELKNITEFDNKLILDIRDVGEWKNTEIITLNIENKNIQRVNNFENKKILITNYNDLIIYTNLSEGEIRLYKEDD